MGLRRVDEALALHHRSSRAKKAAALLREHALSLRFRISHRRVASYVRPSGVSVLSGARAAEIQTRSNVARMPRLRAVCAMLVWLLVTKLTASDMNSAVD